MAYCEICGSELVLKKSNDEIFPYCTKCGAFRFERFNVAVSMVVVSPDLQKVLLIQQYGSKRNILVAGYVNKGESAEEACRRELAEETSLKIQRLHFQKSKYYPKSNTLMLNYVVVTTDQNIQTNQEIDAYHWFTLEEAKEEIAKGSLAEEFFLMYYKQVK